jgi:hypothetical protein
MKKPIKNISDEFRPIEPAVRNECGSEKDVNDALRLVIELRKIGGKRRTTRR